MNIMFYLHGVVTTAIHPILAHHLDRPNIIWHAVEPSKNVWGPSISNRLHTLCCGWLLMRRRCWQLSRSLGRVYRLEHWLSFFPRHFCSTNRSENNEKKYIYYKKSTIHHHNQDVNNLHNKYFFKVIWIFLR